MNTLDRNMLSDFTDKDYAHAYMGEILNAHIATQIKVLREQHEWSQIALAEEAGMKQARISLLENVNYSSWSINTLRKLAKAFDLVLWVSFESFTTGMRKVENMSRENLQRVSREDDLKTYSKAPLRNLELAPRTEQNLETPGYQMAMPLMALIPGGSSLSQAASIFPDQTPPSELTKPAFVLSAAR